MIGEEGEEIVQKIDDIDDPNYYSIELEKQKAEHDRMVKLAEEKKQVHFIRLRQCWFPSQKSFRIFFMRAHHKI